jgi:hypothetical protein
LQLLLISQGRTLLPTLEELALRVMREDPSIRASALLDRPNRSQWRSLLPLLLHRTLVVSMRPLKRLRPWRGTVLQGRASTKAWELARLEAAGVPVPRWHLVDGPDAPPPPDLGPWLVSKPNRARSGRWIYPVPARHVRWRKRYAERGGVVFQEFVYTGRWPVGYRVNTLLGEVLYASRSEGSHAYPPLEERSGFQGVADPSGVPIVSGSKKAVFTLCFDEEILAQARRAAAAFPEIPLLGIDLVRDVETGRCYVLEVNARGGTWHMNSSVGLDIQRANGIDFRAQFDGMAVAARTLAAETRRRAC